MRFQVPQFIETETKVVGPFTFKQFIYIGLAGGIVILLRYVFSSMTWWLLSSLPIVLLALALAFYKIDGIPFPKYILMAFSFMGGPKRYVFKEDPKQENNYANSDKSNN